ncbi:hypothetical protein Q3G72_010013 [Acer saccharum]|nr:hypothetical protein Q3G72_010013 [Acer saccharum]
MKYPYQSQTLKPIWQAQQIFFFGFDSGTDVVIADPWFGCDSAVATVEEEPFKVSPPIVTSVSSIQDNMLYKQKGINYAAPSEQENSPYGPWLLVSYGKWGPSNYKGKLGRHIAGIQGTKESMGGVGKTGVSSNGKKPTVGTNGNGKAGANGSGYSGVSSTLSAVNASTFIPVKNGVQIDSALLRKNNNSGRASGSRFDVLGEEESNVLPGVEQNVATKASGSVIQKGKVVLTEITNCSSTKGEISNRISSQGNKKNRKKGGAVVITDINLESLEKPCGVGASAIRPIDNYPPKQAVDDEDLDSAGVLRHLHMEVTDLVARQVDFMDTVEGVTSKDDSSSVINKDGNLMWWQLSSLRLWQ